MVNKNHFRSGTKVYLKVGNKSIRGKVEEDSIFKVLSSSGNKKGTNRRQIMVNTSKGQYLVDPRRVKKRFF